MRSLFLSLHIIPILMSIHLFMGIVVNASIRAIHFTEWLSIFIVSFESIFILVTIEK